MLAAKAFRIAAEGPGDELSAIEKAGEFAPEGRPGIPLNRSRPRLDGECEREAAHGFTADIACAAVDNEVGHFTPLSGHRDGPQSWGFRPGAGAASQLPALAGYATNRPSRGRRDIPTGRR